MTAPVPPERARWAAATDLFARALEQPESTRTFFVRGECGDDLALAEDVLSLLDAHKRAGDFIEHAATTLAADATPGLLAPGREVGHYRVTGLLGEGGMGVVYLAHDTRLGRTVALKAITPALSTDPTRAARLRREARAAAALNHPNIATVYALEEIDGQLFIAAEYVPGETLREELTRGALSYARARDTVVQIAHALAVAHAAGIIHRDLKPENVIRTSEGRVKILDFGLAQFREGPDRMTDLTGDGGVIGTPAYMSPEQIRGAALDGRSDLFSLGVLFYELVTGRHPFSGATPVSTIAHILQDEPSALSEAAEGLPLGLALDQLQTIITRCLRKSPDDRFRSAGDLAAAVELAGHASLPATAATIGSRETVLGSAPLAERSHRALWWWQFHQGTAAVAYLLLLVPLWHVRHLTAGGLGMGAFLAGLVAVIVASGLRLHVWFAARQYPDDWPAHHARIRRWTAMADGAFVLALLVGGGIVAGSDDRAASLLVAAAAGVAVSAVVIEPATARAAFRN